MANELDSTIAVCGYHGDTGKLTPGAAQTTVPAGSPQNYPAEAIVSADGRFVYLTNRGHNGIAVVDQQTGALTPSAAGAFSTPIPVCILPG